jgi:hypothetical protein
MAQGKNLRPAKPFDNLATRAPRGNVSGGRLNNRRPIPKSQTLSRNEII